MQRKKTLLGIGLLSSCLISAPSLTHADQACIGSGTNCSTNTNVLVTITPWDVCIGSEWEFNFGSITVSTSSQMLSGSFASEFWVEDLKWADEWYYTTVQMSGDLVGSGSNTIPSANIAMMAPSGIVVLGGSSNTRVVVDNAISSSYQALDASLTLIKRDSATNDGILWRYGTIPSLQIEIPAYQAVGTYSGTLVYTFYEN